MKKIYPFIVCTIIGAAVILCAPCVLSAWNAAWNNGMNQFGSKFISAWTRYFTVGNVVVSILAAMLLQPVFEFINWLMMGTRKTKKP